MLFHSWFRASGFTRIAISTFFLIYCESGVIDYRTISLQAKETGKCISTSRLKTCVYLCLFGVAAGHVIDPAFTCSAPVQDISIVEEQPEFSFCRFRAV